MSESNLQFDLSKLNFNPMKTRKNSKEKNEKSTAVTNKINKQHKTDTRYTYCREIQLISIFLLN